MFKNAIMWILAKVFKVQTETKPKEIDENNVYARDYERIDDINFNAIFSNKLANYVMNDSEMEIQGENARVDLLSKTGQSLWKKGKKFTSMAFGYGGVFIVPYVQGGKVYYSLVPQNRVTIDKTDGDLIVGATILAEKKVITTERAEKIYIRWSNYKVENGNITITQEFTDNTGTKIPVPDFWANLPIKQVFTGVDRVLFGYIKSPINNRKANDKYGVPITYGCEATIKEIKDTMKQMVKEYKLKENFIAIDSTMFGKNNELAKEGLYKMFDTPGEIGKSGFWEIYDPQFRDYTLRLQELYKRLEHEIGTSYGILSEVTTNQATATEIKRSMYDTFTIVDDMRSNIEKGLDDFFYACNVLANVYNLTPQGEYETSFNWSYTLLEDTQQEWSQMIVAMNNGIVSKTEVRQWLYPDENEEEAKQAIEDIKAENPNVEDLLGR